MKKVSELNYNIPVYINSTSNDSCLLTLKNFDINKDLFIILNRHDRLAIGTRENNITSIIGWINIDDISIIAYDEKTIDEIISSGNFII